jgi:adenylate cyclase
MRRLVTPSIVIALVAMIVGFIYRHFADDPADATLPNYARSGLHAMGIALSGWAVHLYFISRRSEWIRRWPLWFELCLRSLLMAIVVAIAVVTLQVALYSNRLEAAWLAAKFPQIFGISLIMSIVVGAIFELTQLVGSWVLLNVVIGRYRRPKREARALMFLDLSGSTSLAESMGELRTYDFLARFFFDIDEAILAHGGEVHAYVGDEVIVTWPLTGPASAAGCIDCFFCDPGQDRGESGPVPPRIWPRTTIPRRLACWSSGDQRMRRLAPSDRLLRRQHECHSAHSGAVQGNRSESACFG